MKAWKVLSKGRHSSFAQKELRLRYPVNVKVEQTENPVNSKMTPLFAYDTHEHAKQVAMEKDTIVPCEVEIDKLAKRTDLFSLFSHLLNSGFRTSTWKGFPVSVIPDGTLYCKSITCLE